MLSGCTPCVEDALHFAGECRSDAKGTWRMSVTQPSLDIVHGDVQAYGFAFRMVRRPACDDAGACDVWAVGELTNVRLEAAAKPKLAWQTFDYDGDGVPEVLADTVGVSIFTAHKTPRGEWEVVPYPPASRLRVAAVADLDHDGRPDLRTTAGYPGPPMFVAHSLPDGSFSESDAVAKPAFANACPASGEELLGELSIDTPDLMRRIACARARGRSIAEVTAALSPLRAPPPSPRDAGPKGAVELPRKIVLAVSITPPVSLP